MQELEFIITIGNRNDGKAISSTLEKAGGFCFNSFFGKGIVRASEILQALGLVTNQSKIVITCIIEKEKACTALKLLETVNHFTKPNTGIAFAIPLNKMGGNA
ncbi:MAG: hypothetical protein LBM99_05850 [Bacillales bacterium]|jgi:hypothetical protein|nr:hypothetical protein [Bacillales bacterium]